MRRWALCLAVLSLAAGACSSANPGGLPSSLPPSGPPSGSPSSPGPPPRWVALAAAPIAGRISEGVVWTGKEMIVWGGVSGGAQLGDGAAYDRSTDSWRGLAPPPPGGLGGGGGAAGRARHPAGVWGGGAPAAPPAGAGCGPPPPPP